MIIFRVKLVKTLLTSFTLEMVILYLFIFYSYFIKTLITYLLTWLSPLQYNTVQYVDRWSDQLSKQLLITGAQVKLSEMRVE